MSAGQAWRAKLTPFFRAYWRVSRAMTLGVRGLARDAEGRVLLVEHSYRPGWFLPGGGVERGETAEESLVREMAEEAGIAPTGPPRLFGLYSNHRHFPNDHVALFVIDAWTPCAPAQDGEILRRGFFDVHALPDGVSAGTRARILEVVEGRAPAAYW